VAKAMEVATVTEAVLVSNFSEGYDRVDAVRAKYEASPGSNTSTATSRLSCLKRHTTSCVKKGAKFLPGIDFLYGPDVGAAQPEDTPALDPGEDDIDAPSAETARRLKTLATKDARS